MSTQLLAGTQDVPLLRTKLYVPSIRRERVCRVRLIERLNAGLDRKLTLVSAPAGFGKTTLVSEWIRNRDGAQTRSAAWLSLDADDNEPIRFWQYVTAALQTIDPAIGRTAQGMLHTHQPGSPDPRPVVTALINDLTGLLDRDDTPTTPYILVLDDYHVIEHGPIHESLDFLLDHLPSTLHLVITTREDPPLSLSRLRGRGRLAEIRAADLCFTIEETAEFLNAVMDLGLSPEEIAALDQRTEGWVVGLQMAALSLQGQAPPERQGFVAAFAGDDRYVADYLVDEVLRRQPPHVQRFLIETSILSRLCGPLCDAVLEADRGSSQAVLCDLEESNLFVVPLDSRRHWYRYHRLFADLLQSRLEETRPDQIPELHLRASEWYEREGLISEAASHALSAADQERVAALMERHSERMMRRGEFGLVDHWMRLLPEDIVRPRPLLCMHRAWALCHPGTRELAVQWMARALEMAGAHPRPLNDPDFPYDTDYARIAVQASMFHINVIRMGGDDEEAVRLCLKALDDIPSEDTFWRAIAVVYLAQAYDHLGDSDAAARAWAAARQMGQGRDEPFIAHVLASIQAERAWARGDLYAVARICRQAMQQPVKLPMICFAHVYLGRVLLEWNDLSQATPLLIQGTALAEQAREQGLYVLGCRDLAVLSRVQGNYQEAHAWMDRAVQACEQDPDYLHALRARIWLAQTEDDPRWLEEAIRWADEHTLVDPGQYSWELQSLARVRIAQYRAYGEPDLAPVLDVLDQHLQSGLSRSSGWTCQVLLLIALAHQALGEVNEALVALGRALAVGEETGRVLGFLEHGAPMADLLDEAVRRGIEADYARQVLDAFQAMTRKRREAESIAAPRTGSLPSQASLVEPLSERELEVLRLLATTLSGPQIADALVISLSTLRSHTKSIYSKLDVHSRLDAVAQGIALGLLAE